MRAMRFVLSVPGIVMVTAAAVFAQSQGPVAVSDSDHAKFDRYEDFVRRRNAADYKVIGPDPIDEGRFVRVGGIDQWLTIRGADRRNPVLLILHGGPGDATNPWGYAAFRDWLKRFTVVQWDQRGAGKTLRQNGGEAIGPTMTVDRMVQDGLELTDSIRAELHQQKIVIVGHSWGTVLGVLMAKSRPELFYAYVGTGQIGDTSARENAVAYAELLKREERLGNTTAVRELREVGPPPWNNSPGFLVKRRWANRLENADVFLASTVGFALLAPGNSLRDVNDWFDGQVLADEFLVSKGQIDKVGRATFRGDFALPVIVIQGADDFTSPGSLARAFVDSIRAPKKAFVTIQAAGHFAMFTKQREFLDALDAHVLPLLPKR
jgi:pimeloyl-ACP methyl ester carboxylesterase